MATFTCYYVVEVMPDKPDEIVGMLAGPIAKKEWADNVVSNGRYMQLTRGSLQQVVEVEVPCQLIGFAKPWPEPEPLRRSY